MLHQKAFTRKNCIEGLCKKSLENTLKEIMWKRIISASKELYKLKFHLCQLQKGLL